MKRTELGAGAKSLERGSTFASRGQGLKRTASASPRRRPVSPASAAQRAKVARAGCVVTAAVEGVDPAHLWPRGLGGCDHEDCIVGLRRDIHRQFDEGGYDLLPHLVAHGYWKEIAHMIEVHHVDPIALLERLTGARCQLLARHS